MCDIFDVVVVGLGIHGSSSLAFLARENCRCLGIEKFPETSHAHGSSHGNSRIIRKAYFEDPVYVPLLSRAFTLWRQLQIDVNEQLLIMTGGLMIGKSGSEVIKGAVQSAQVHKLEHSILSAEVIHQRFPCFKPASDEIGLFEDEAGYLLPEKCIEAYRSVARQHGATLQFDEALIDWSVHADADGQELIALSTTRGMYRARKLVLAVGAWAEQVYGAHCPVPVYVQRNVMHWLQPASASNTHDQSPVFIWDAGEQRFYGFPTDAEGVKVALHSTEWKYAAGLCKPDTIERTVSAVEVEGMRAVLRGRLPLLSEAPLVASKTCMYTCTRDEHFLIDFAPVSKSVLLVSPCSGHGFKFGSVVGEIVRDLLLDGASQFDLSVFTIAAHLERIQLTSP